MLCYEGLKEALCAHADEGYRAFQKRLLKCEAVAVVGVRMPVLRRMAKSLDAEWHTLLSFPDDVYEVALLKRLVASRLTWEQFCPVADGLVETLNNWAVCDAFVPGCVRGARAAFVPFLQRYLADGREFVARFVYTTLLHFYIDREYLSFVFACLGALPADAPYYTVMGAAWLLAEVLVKFYDEGSAFLRRAALPAPLYRAAIRKACESYRIGALQKAALLALKREKTAPRG